MALRLSCNLSHLAVPGIPPSGHRPTLTERVLPESGRLCGLLSTGLPHVLSEQGQLKEPSKSRLSSLELERKAWRAGEVSSEGGLVCGRFHAGNHRGGRRHHSSAREEVATV